MIYGIVEHHEDGDDTKYPYFVVDSRTGSANSYIGPKFTEAEASICAFGLTTIAQGGVLCAIDQATLGVMFAHGFGVVTYDGSTEGIA